MTDNWIYIGANIERLEWSKVGKTTVGLYTRHTSPQTPEYFLYVAFEIKNGDVNLIESCLLRYLRSNFPEKIQFHFTTGNETECFSISPYSMAQIVERFIEENFPSSVIYDHVFDIVKRYQCESTVYNHFKPKVGSKYESECWDILMPEIPSNLGISKKDYFSGNQIRHEEDLGSGYYIDFESGLQMYREEDDDDV